MLSSDVSIHHCWQHDQFDLVCALWLSRRSRNWALWIWIPHHRRPPPDFHARKFAARTRRGDQSGSVDRATATRQTVIIAFTGSVASACPWARKWHSAIVDPLSLWLIITILSIAVLLFACLWLIKSTSDHIYAPLITRTHRPTKPLRAVDSRPTRISL